MIGQWSVLAAQSSQQCNAKPLRAATQFKQQNWTEAAQIKRACELVGVPIQGSSLFLPSASKSKSGN